MRCLAGHGGQLSVGIGCSPLAPLLSQAGRDQRRLLGDRADRVDGYIADGLGEAVEAGEREQRAWPEVRAIHLHQKRGRRRCDSGIYDHRLHDRKRAVAGI